jgi:maltooligosyltrehalose trehalohydrolase
VTAFRVWAPRAERVELALVPADWAQGTGAQPTAPLRLAMLRENGGWWSIEVPDAGPGTDYGYVLDGAGQFPDPRSPWQPGGVHGLSRTVDHAAFQWTDGDWQAPPLEEAVIYELHVGAFSPAGTFDGVIGRLDHLVGLGVTHIELMPVVEFPGWHGWGYDGVDLFAPHHAYGGPEGLKRLVDACHGRGLAVLVDVVWNHLGPDGNYLARFGPYFTDRYRTPWGEAVNFDGPGSDEVRAFVIDNARLWLRDYHADGLRIDAVHAIFDQSATHILEAVASEVHALAGRAGRRLVAIAESDLNDPRLVRDVARGGYGLDAQWNDDFRHALHVALTGEADGYHAQYRGLVDVAAALRSVFVYDGRYSSFRGRAHGRPVGDLPSTRFIGFLQNHDQVGNRARGERIGHLVSPEAVRAGAALVLLGPFIPLLFAGEEWAATSPFQYFTDHPDEALGAAVREGRRQEFPAFQRDGIEVPDPQAPATFERSQLDWAEREREPHASVLAWYRELIAYRTAHPAVHDGSRPAVTLDEHEGWIAVAHGSTRLVANLGPVERTVSLNGPRSWRTVLASADGVIVDGAVLHLPAWSAGVVEPLDAA